MVDVKVGTVINEENIVDVMVGTVGSLVSIVRILRNKDFVPRTFSSH